MIVAVSCILIEVIDLYGYCWFYCFFFFFFFSSRRRHTRCSRDWSSDVCSSDLVQNTVAVLVRGATLCVYARPDGRAGALVEPVVHAVAVGVHRAATHIHGGGHWRVGTRVPLIGDSVMVGVGRGAATSGEDGQA